MEAGDPRDGATVTQMGPALTVSPTVRKKKTKLVFFLSAQTLNTVFYLDIEAVLCVNVLILSSGYDLHGVHTFYKSLVEVEIII